jgi:hypothetical protein
MILLDNKGIESVVINLDVKHRLLHLHN